MKGNYRIEIKKSAAKEIKSLPENYIRRVINKIESLSFNPHPEGCKKLTKTSNYRIRIGVYRIVYNIQDDKLIVIVIKVRHRKNIYK